MNTWADQNEHVGGSEQTGHVVGYLFRRRESGVLELVENWGDTDRSKVRGVGGARGEVMSGGSGTA